MNKIHNEVNGFSVIIPYFNGSRFIKEAIESVSRIELPAESLMEVIIIDDCSSLDEYRKLLEAVETTPVKETISLRIFRNSVNKGIPATRNKGILEARYNIILFLDQDDLVLPHILREFQSFYSSKVNCGIGAIYGGVIPDRLVKYSKVPRYFGIPLSFPFYEDMFLINKYNAYLMLKFPLQSASGLIVRKELFRDLGLLDETLYSGDEIEFVCRLLRDHCVIFVNRPWIIKREHSNNASKSIWAQMKTSEDLLTKCSNNLGIPRTSELFARAYFLHTLKMFVLHADKIKRVLLDNSSLEQRIILFPFYFILKIATRLLRILVRRAEISLERGM